MATGKRITEQRAAKAATTKPKAAPKAAPKAPTAKRPAITKGTPAGQATVYVLTEPGVELLAEPGRRAAVEATCRDYVALKGHRHGWTFDHVGLTGPAGAGRIMAAVIINTPDTITAPADAMAERVEAINGDLTERRKAAARKAVETRNANKAARAASA